VRDTERWTGQWSSQWNPGSVSLAGYGSLLLQTEDRVRGFHTQTPDSVFSPCRREQSTLARTGAQRRSLHISEEENLITAIDRRATRMYMNVRNDHRSAIAAEYCMFRTCYQEPGI